MKVLVLGAGGKTGRLVIERAVAAGHTVTALAHTVNEKEQFPDSVNLVHGDVRNPSRLDQVMTGQDAVIDTLGGKTPWAETDLESSAADVVIEVMKRNDVKRLVVVSVLGEGDSEEQAGWFYQHLMMPTFLRGALKDKAAMEQKVEASGLDFVIVRPPVLSDSDPTGMVKIVSTGETARKITRGDLAQFLVDQLTSDVYLSQEITVANS
jgi:putative NADH-flavin reductase